MRFLHLLPEEQEGAKLTQDEAKGKALVFLMEEMAFLPSEYELVKASTEEKKARADHFLFWLKGKTYFFPFHLSG